MTKINVNPLVFNYSDEDIKLFDSKQHAHWKSIEDFYLKLNNECLSEIRLPQVCPSQEWVVSRVHLHVSQSLLRLLNLTEAFCNASKEFNIMSAAALIKAMTEIPLHIGYILWILRTHKDYSVARKKIMELAIGERDSITGFTSKSRVGQKTLYIRADEVIRDLFGNKSSDVGIFETLYKESNVVGHNNFEARMLTGIYDLKENIWRAGGKKDLFILFTNGMFPLFFYCDAILSMSYVLFQAIDRQLKTTPD